MAKQLEIDPSTTYTYAQYIGFQDHLRNSALWYASNKMMNTAQMKEKILAKGVPDEEITITMNSGETLRVNLIEECIGFLQRAHLIDDLSYAKRVVEMHLRKGRGLGSVRSLRWAKKIDEETMEEALAELEEEYDWEDQRFEAIAKAMSKIQRSSTYRKAQQAEEAGTWGKPKPRQVLMNKLREAGFSSEDVQEYLDHLEELEENDLG